jgi:ATP-binding cassette subfamily F protein uup
VTLGLDGSGRVDIVAGGYEDWIRQRAPARAPAKAGAQLSRRSSPEGTGPLPAPGNKKLSFKDQRDLDRLPGEIERIEREIAAAEEALSDPDLYTRDHKRFSELTAKADKLRADKDSAEERWLQVAEMAEALA